MIGQKTVQLSTSTVQSVYEISISKGWHNKDYSDAHWIALMHSELSEAIEALRLGNPPDRHLPDFDSCTVELADCIIRIFDFAGQHNLPIIEAVLAKIEYNRTRDLMHGGKMF